MSNGSSDYLIKAEDISFHYPTSPTKIFQHLTFGIKNNEIVGVLGESGSGKTTLIKILAGLERPAAGTINRFCSTKGSFVFQSPVLLDWLNVMDNITFPDKLTAHGEEMLTLLRDVGLEAAKNKFPRELSGGMRSRVQLARALYRQPKILFLDEAFSALDERLRYQLNLLLKKLRERYMFSAILISHSVQEAVFLSDRLLILKKDKPDSPALMQEMSDGLTFSKKLIDVLETEEFTAQITRVRQKILSKELS